MRLGFGLGLGKGQRSNPLRPWFNGLAASGYTGGPVAALDYQGVLQPGALNVPSIEGGRWATTVAEGAVLGPELWNWPVFATRITDAGGTVGVCANSTMSNSGATVSTHPRFAFGSLITVGKRYRVAGRLSGDISQMASSIPVRLAFSGAANNIPYNPNTGEFSGETVAAITGIEFVTELNGSEAVTIAELSIREVIPQWLPTDTDGSLLYPAKTTRGQLDFLDADPLEFKRYLSMPARTNLFLNSAAPVTQNITTTAQQYAVSVIGAGSVELSGTATGTATAASPLVVTASAGTLTVTVTAPLTHVQVEAGAFATPPIPTAGTAVTRDPTVCPLPAAGVLRSNNLGGRCQAIPLAAGQTGWIWNTYSDANNGLGLLVAPTSLTLRKRTGGTNTDCSISYTHAANTPLQVDWYQAATGMGIRYRAWTGAAWSAWSDWTEVTTDAGKADAVIASTYQIGTRNALECFAGNVQFAKPVWSSTPKTVVEAL